MAYNPPPRSGIADSSSMNEGLLFEDDDDDIDEFGRHSSRKYGLWRRLHDRVGELLDARRVSVFSLLLLVIFVLAIALIVESGKAGGRPGPSPSPTPSPSPVPPIPDSTVSVSVRFDETLPESGGRLLLYITRANGDDDKTEPRNPPLASDDQNTAQVFGTSVAANSDRAFTFTGATARGYPRTSLDDLEPGQYVIQAQLFVFRTYNRESGAVELRSSCVSPYGQDGSYGAPIGTQYSLPKVVTIEGKNTTVSAAAVKGDDDKQSLQDFELVIDQVESSEGKTKMGCAGPGQDDSDYIKTLRIKSTLLSTFWGEDVYITACVLLPMGFDLEEHAQAKYPLVVAHGHYSPVFAPGGGFSETPPASGLSGYARVSAEYDHYLYTNWTSTDGLFTNARMIVMTINHDNPFFDDSYAVNSENLGPYGDAIQTELIPAVEEKYRGIGEGWARATFGGSTGGWEAIAVQVFYPDFYNSCFAACPDPISFRSYATVDLREDENAYYYNSPFKRTARPGQRDHYSGQTLDDDGNPTYGRPEGQTAATIMEMNHRELVMGEKSSSCGQWDIWEAVWSPRGEDNYPARIWDKDTGVINKTVAKHWIDNWDIVEHMKKNWEYGLGEKLKGKLHVFAGADDTFFLSNAVMDAQDFLESTTNPYYDGEVVIGEHDGRGFAHCFNGYSYAADNKTKLPNAITREMYVQKFVPIAAEHFFLTAPSDVDRDDPVLMGWRY